MQTRSILKVAAALALAVIAGTALASPDIAAHVWHAVSTQADLFGSAGAALAFGPLVRTLQAKQTEEVARMSALNKAAAEADRDFTTEEQAVFDKLKASTESRKARITTAIETELAEAGVAGSAAAAAAQQLAITQTTDGGRAVTVPGTQILATTENLDADPRRGFAHMGEFARTVLNGQFAVRTGNGTLDRRLMALGGYQAAAPSTYGNESSGADGGFLVPPQFASTIFSLSLEEQSLLPLADNMPIEGNSMSLPKDETTPWGSNGVRAYWQGEATAGTPTKPVLGRADLRLKKLLALVPMSDELMADATALNAYIPPNMARSIRWKSDDAILFGNGSGVPLGAFSGTSFVTQAAEGGQTAGTIVFNNVAKMIARLLPGSYSRAVWLVNNDALPQLFTMTLGNYPIYLPVGAGSGGAQLSPYGTLMGRPIVVSQHAKSIGTAGDIMLVDMSYYQAITKSGGITTATSMHLYFDADAVAFRATFRMDGQPKLAAPVSPANGSTTLSPFIQLAAR